MVTGSLSEVGDQEDNCEDDAEGAHHDVADGEEVVLASEGVGRGEHEALLSVEAGHVVGVFDLQIVGARLDVCLEFAVKLSEVGKTSSPHPDNEVL
jgi:hypothetical protein